MTSTQPSSKPGPATQRYLDIAEIRDDMVIMNDGTVRSVLLVSSINFALKSEDEQEAIISSYVTFLNGLDYPIQVVIQSRRMNIDNYILALGEQEKKTENDLLRAQIGDYRAFVTQLVELGHIMQKRFYVVIPYDPLTNKKRGFMQRLSLVLSPAAAAKLNEKQLEDRREQLSRRTGMAGGNLLSMGLQTARLDTQGLIELYYDAYNPDLFEAERMGDMANIRSEE